MRKILLIIMIAILSVCSIALVGCGEDKYTITFDANGGVVSVSEKTVIINQPIGELPTPERAGYEFVKWVYVRPDFEDQEITSSTVYKFRSDITLVAVWTSVVDEDGNYQIILNLDGGEIAGEYKNLYKTEDPSFDLPTPTKEYHRFLGWTGEGVTTPTKTITIETGSSGTKTYTANWKRMTYTVSLDLTDKVDGVTVNGSISNGTTVFEVEYGYPLYHYLGDAYAEGYDFVNWVFVDGNEEIELETDTYFSEYIFGKNNNVTLKANFVRSRQDALYRIVIELSHKISDNLTVTGRYDADEDVVGNQHVLYVTDANVKFKDLFGKVDDNTCSDPYYGFKRWVLVKSDGTRVEIKDTDTFSTEIFGTTGTTIVIAAEYVLCYSDWV